MFGRIRSSSSPDSLERPPSKILKDDCLSIYETTLMKLKLGSQLDSSPPIKEDALEDGETDSNSSSSCNEAMNTETCASFPKTDLMTVDSDYSTTSTTTTSEASENCQSAESSTQPKIKNSILHLFSKFKNSPEISSIMEEPAMTEDFCCMVMSASSSASQSTSNIELNSEQESIGSTMSSEEVL